jgi:hypothetical protein
MKHLNAEQKENADQDEIFLVCKLQGNGSYDCKRIDRIPCDIPANPSHVENVGNPAVVSEIEHESDNDVKEVITPDDFFVDDSESEEGDSGDADRKTTDHTHPKRKLRNYSKKMGTCPIIHHDEFAEDSSK